MSWRFAPTATAVGSLVTPTPPVRRLSDALRHHVQAMARLDFRSAGEIASTLTRAGWTLAAQTVRRILAEPPVTPVPPAIALSARAGALPGWSPYAGPISGGPSTSPASRPSSASDTPFVRGRQAAGPDPHVLASFSVPRQYAHIHRDEQRAEWTVQLVRRGRRYRGSFADRGDRAAALRRALSWRDRLLQALPPPRRFKLSYRWNTTGVVGVHVRRDRRRGRRRDRLSYVACWVDEHGRNQKRTFSVAQYGAERARALAIRARRQALRQLLHPPASDPRAALKDALIWRRKMKATLPPSLRLHRKNSRNRSGVIGVQLRRVRQGREPILYWVAVCYPAPGLRRARHYSAGKYGYAKARALAIQARKEMIKTLRRQSRIP